MNLDRYELELSKIPTTFSFISDGNLGKIEKSIKYDEMQGGIYNLGFGDKHPITGEIDNTIVTNNGDMTKILATVAASIYFFTEKNPNVWIYITGSSESRIRLYRMAINKHHKEIFRDFLVYVSLENGDWHPFEPNIKTTSLLMQRRI
jgi:hypothetical protein